MRVLFVYPRFDKYRASPALEGLPRAPSVWGFTMPPSLAIPTLAALTPADAEFRVWDQNTAPRPDWGFDLAAVSYFTPQAHWAHELADGFRREGRAVVLGGLHPSMAPDDAAPHGDAVCVGEGEALWPAILEDFKRGSLKPRYEADPFPRLSISTRPLRDVFDRKAYALDADIVSFTRGCVYACSWCCIPSVQGRSLRLRPARDVAEELLGLAGRSVFASDDAILLPRRDTADRLGEVLALLGGAKVRLFLSGSPAMNRDPALLDALAKAGTRHVYVVFGDDPASRAVLGREPAARARALELVRLIEGRGMRFFASFGVGYDFAGPEIFDAILDFLREAKVTLAEFFVATPFPGTPFWKALERADRLIRPVDWRRYNAGHVVFRPKLMSPEALAGGYGRLWREFYRGREAEGAL